MRQESRFVTAARSGVGAQGLMQIMPATGKWVAGKLGMSGYNVGWLQDPDTNVMLGTTYMRMVLEGLDNHPVLASAAYNAGPGRAKKWKDVKPLEGAIYAECIPFNETRDYVKKVMANAVIYAALFEGRAPSLKARLGTIAASDGSTRGLGSAAPGAGLDEPTPGAGSNE
jgi:soluble lytic murein transglycosylase